MSFFGYRLPLFVLLLSLSHLILVFVAFLVKQYVDQLASRNDPLFFLLPIASLMMISLILKSWANIELYQMTSALRKGLTGLLFAKSLRLS